MQVHEKKVNITKELDFFKKLSEKVSDCFGFEVDFSHQIWDEEVSFKAEATHSLGLPSDYYVSLTRKLFKRLSKITDDYYNCFGLSNYTNVGFINNIIKDLSLSLIFDNYKVLDHGSQKYEDLINELKDIGSRSYEGKAVDIGVIYCPTTLALTQILQIKDADFISLPTAKSIKEFFNEEKPFLRLIDNMSLSIVINSEFKVIAIMRKKAAKKSLNYLLEDEFNIYLKHRLHIVAINHFFNTMKEILNKAGNKKFQSELEKLRKDFKKLEKYNIDKLRAENVKSPEYTYFSIQSSKMKIFTKNEFVLTYSNGDWKLKHYNFIRSIITNYLRVHKFRDLVASFVDLKPDKILRIFKKIIGSTDKLVEKLLRLSESNISAIILIDQQPKNKGSKVNTVLKSRKKPEPYYLNVLKNKRNNMNIENVDYYLFESIASIDGALILDIDLKILSFGEIINTSAKVYPDTYGTGTTAARYASNSSLAIKVSEDGDIYIFDQENLRLKI
ncbi:hypothetical protein MUU70_02545 [Bacillus velezensis]|uniref:hypothetical protein n=1 Tax=Bacillus velezensis TaxID=492670 RepID=UPI00345AAD27